MVSLPTLTDKRPSNTRTRAKHTITVEPTRIDNRPSVTHLVVERFGSGFAHVLTDNTHLRAGETLEYVAQRLAALYEAEFVRVAPAPGYTASRELPADCVDVGDQVARADGKAKTYWSTVRWVDDCDGANCSEVAKCSGVLGFDDGSEVHYDVVDRPTVRIPMAVTA